MQWQAIASTRRPKSFRFLSGRRNFLVAHDVDAPFKRKYFDLEVEVCPLEGLIEQLGGQAEDLIPIPERDRAERR
jgi:hypothetical protein